MNEKWREKFEKRLLEFSISIIKIANQFPKSPAGFYIASQVIRSATSIGANYVESRDASSTKHFIEKLSISLREARETLYWLKVVDGAELIKDEALYIAMRESDEIIAILSKSVKSSKLKLK